MVSLDADVAGCVSVWLRNNGELDDRRWETLATCEQRLKRVLPKLSGYEAAYGAPAASHQSRIASRGSLETTEPRIHDRTRGSVIGELPHHEREINPGDHQRWSRS